MGSYHEEIRGGGGVGECINPELWPINNSGLRFVVERDAFIPEWFMDVA